jgi:hypothetical protein
LLRGSFSLDDPVTEGGAQVLNRAGFEHGSAPGIAKQVGSSTMIAAHHGNAAHERLIHHSSPSVIFAGEQQEVGLRVELRYAVLRDGRLEMNPVMCGALCGFLFPVRKAPAISHDVEMTMRQVEAREAADHGRAVLLWDCSSQVQDPEAVEFSVADAAGL